MSDSQPVPEGHSQVVTEPVTQEPWRNPSYPQRVHLRERAHWQDVLKACRERVDAAGDELAALGNSPQRDGLERFYVQMRGACDQVADAVRRLPMETGDLYEEDHHRVEEAMAALERVSQRWDSQKA